MPTEHRDQSANVESAHATPQLAESLGPDVETSPAVPTGFLPALLANPHIQRRGNGPTQQAVILGLQRMQGNRATRRLLQRQQTSANTPEGDGVAAATDLTQEPGEDNIGARIQAHAGGGSPLAPDVRRQFETGLGADLSNVRVHTDGEADHLSHAVDAVAFTTGSDIFFRAGTYDPGSSDGLHLLAHEVTHTVQQGAGPVAGTPTIGGVALSDPSDSFEQAAEQSATAIVSGQGSQASAGGATAAASAVQRQAVPAEEELSKRSLDEEVAPVQSMPAVQRQAVPIEEEPSRRSLDEDVAPVQTMPVQRQAAAPEEALPKRSLDEDAAPVQTMPAVQRGPKGTFDPQVKSDVGSVFTLLNSDTTVGVKVVNASQAPHGTTYAWRWGQLDQGLMAPGPTIPPTAPRATLHARSRKVGNTDAIPELETWSPDGNSTKKRTAPVPLTVMAPVPQWKPPTIRPGARGSGKTRTPAHMFAGDTVVQQVTFDQVEAARDAGLTLLVITVSTPGRAGNFQVGKTTWVSPNTAEWTITCTTPGETSFNFSAQAPGQEDAVSHDLRLKAVADATLFKARCDTAETTLNTAHAAGHKWFMQAFNNYTTAHENHTAALKAQSDADHLVAELLLGVLLTPLAGAAGGAIGVAFKGAEKTLTEAFGKVALGSITDASKDLAKFAIKDGIKAAVKAGGGGGGHGGAAAIDPLHWLAAVDAGIAGEREEAGTILKALHEEADNAIASNPNKEFDWDPVEVVMEGAKLNGLPLTDLGEVPTDLYYERKMWAVWLGHYGYKLHYTSDVLFASNWSVNKQIGGKLMKEIDRVAQKFGETGEDWVRLYAEPLRQKLEAEKARNEAN